MPQICPCCARRADATARYCRDCYCVFPTARKDNSPRKGERGWTWAPILLLLAGSMWAALRDGETAEPPPSTGAQAAGLDVWRSAPQMKPPDRYTVTRPVPGASGAPRDRGDTAAAEPNDQPAANAAPVKISRDALGAEAECLERARCVMLVWFASGEAASYVLKRRSASILLIAPDERAARLLKENNRASLKVSAAGKGARTVPLRKVIGAQWTT